MGDGGWGATGWETLREKCRALSLSSLSPHSLQSTFSSNTHLLSHRTVLGQHSNQYSMSSFLVQEKFVIYKEIC